MLDFDNLRISREDALELQQEFITEKFQVADEEMHRMVKELISEDLKIKKEKPKEDINPFGIF